MGIVPIFIYVHERSEKEIREEARRDRLMREAERKEEEKERARIAREKEEKRRKKEEAERKLDKEYFEAEMKNPWDYKILLEGWTIFGQGGLKIITEKRW